MISPGGYSSGPDPNQANTVQNCRAGAMVGAIADIVLSALLFIAGIVVGVLTENWLFSVHEMILSISIIWSILVLAMPQEQWPAIMYIVWNSVRIGAETVVCIMILIFIIGNSFSSSYSSGNRYPDYDKDDGTYQDNIDFMGMSSDADDNYKQGIVVGHIQASLTRHLRKKDPSEFGVNSRGGGGGDPSGRSRYSSSSSYPYSWTTEGYLGWLCGTFALITVYGTFVGIMCSYCSSYGKTRPAPPGYYPGQQQSAIYAQPMQQQPMGYNQPPPSYSQQPLPNQYQQPPPSQYQQPPPNQYQQQPPPNQYQQQPPPNQYQQQPPPNQYQQQQPPNQYQQQPPPNQYQQPPPNQYQQQPPPNQYQQPYAPAYPPQG